MVGRVAVWRSPCVQPSDIEVWEAVQWPGDLKAVPTNCIVCSVRGKGITALAGGDSDGDDVAVTLNQDLVEFVEHTEAAVAQLDWEQACKPKKELEVEARKLFSTTADRSPTYLQHMLNVPTPNVRGQATALAEKCQQAVMEAPGDMRLLMCMLQVGFLCHAAYDCPKKFSGKMVLAAIRQVMRAAGVAPTTHRSTWADAWLLASRGLPKATRKPWETVKLETLRDKTQPLGQVWFPLSKIVLGKAAGQWMRPVLQNMKRQWELMWRREPRTCVLLELACLLHHKLIHRVLPAPVLLNEEGVKTMRCRVGATHGNRAFETVRALLDSGVF